MSRHTGTATEQMLRRTLDQRDAQIESLQRALAVAHADAEEARAQLKEAEAEQAAELELRIAVQVAHRYAKTGVKELSDALEAIIGETVVPDRNCSCHLAPPCNWCVEHSHMQELIDTAEALIRTYK